MIKLDSVIKAVKKAKEPIEFDAIFNAVEDEYRSAYEDKNELKADLLNAMIGSIDLIMVGNNKFDIRENYSLNDIKRIERMNIGIDTDSKGE